VLANNNGDPILSSDNYTIFLPYIRYCDRKLTVIKGTNTYTTECKELLMKKCDKTSKNDLMLNVSIFGIILWKKMGIVEGLKKILYCIDDEAWKSGLKLEGFL
jgi:hypothetical protein